MNRGKPRRAVKKPSGVYGSKDSMINAAQGGDLEAQHQVGACFATGDWNGPQDLAEAIKWYTQAAESGHAMSQYDLGFMLLLGEGAEKDVQGGLLWMERAAMQGGDYAARILADIYREGLFGIERNDGKAQYWKEKAESSRGRSKESR